MLLCPVSIACSGCDDAGMAHLQALPALTGVAATSLLAAAGGMDDYSFGRCLILSIDRYT